MYLAGNTGFYFFSVGNLETKPAVNMFLTFFCLKKEETETYSHSQITITAYETAKHYTVRFNIILSINPTDYFYGKNV